VEKFLSGDDGRQFFQVFYNLGAAVVIIGALAKITHWPWGLGNILLTVGLVTECLVFLISAFDKPAREWMWSIVFPELDNGEAREYALHQSGGYEGGTSTGSAADYSSEGSTGHGGGASSGNHGGGFSGGGAGGTVIIGGTSTGSASGVTASTGSATSGGGVVLGGGVIGGGAIGGGFSNPLNISEEDSTALAESIKKMASAVDLLAKMAETTSDVSDGITQSSRGYVQGMEHLNRNIQGLNTIYEIQLKGVSSQIDAIDRINAGLMRIKDLYEGSVVDSSVFRNETEKMTQQLQALNGVYSRLLQAMTTNMPGGFNPIN
jgi:uncharacterized protein YukE